MVVKEKKIMMSAAVNSLPAQLGERREESEKESEKGSGLGCGMAMLRDPAGESPAQIAASHGSGIEPCRCSSNGALDA